MDKLKVLQLSCFLDNRNSKVDNDEIMKYMTLFNGNQINGYLPNIFQIQEVDVKNNRIMPGNILSFISSNNNQIKKQIILDKDRFFINFIFVNETNFSDLSQYIDEESKILSLLLDRYGKKSKRLGLNMTFELNNNDEIKRIMNSSSPSPFYENSISEWYLKVNKNMSFSIDNRDESFNIISDFKLIQNALTSTPSLEYHIDFNTSQKDMNERFNSESISRFVEIFKENKNMYLLECIQNK